MTRFAHRDHVAGQLVAENRRGNNHAGMVPTAKYLHVGAAGQRHLDSNENVSAIDCRNGYRLYLQVFLAVKHGSHHLAIHYDHLCG